jgi:hypothetical protein
LLKNQKILTDPKKINFGKSNLLFVLGIFFIVTVSRSIFFNNLNISGDEATYLLMGKSFLDEKIIYKNLFESKPPLLFYAYALINLISSNNIFIARFIISLIVSLTYIFTYFVMIIKFSDKKKEAFFLTIITIFVSFANVESSMAGMSEHVANFILIIFLFFYFYLKNTNFSNFLSGFLLTACCLVRPNMIFVYIFFLVNLFLKKNFKKIFYYLVASFFVFIIAFSNLLINYEFDLILKLINQGSAQSASSSLTIFKNTIRQLFNLIGLTNLSYKSLLDFIFALFLIISLFNFFSKKTFNKETIFLGFFNFFIFVGVIFTYVAYDHYLIQLYPFLSIFIFYNLQEIKFMKLYLFFSLIIFLYYCYNENLILKKKDIKNLNNYIVENKILSNTNVSNIFYMPGTPHIIDWVNNKRPLTNWAHPSTFVSDRFKKAFKINPKEAFYNSFNSKNTAYLIAKEDFILFLKKNVELNNSEVLLLISKLSKLKEFKVGDETYIIYKKIN